MLRPWLPAAAFTLLLACGGPSPGSGLAGEPSPDAAGAGLRLYTTVTQDTVDAVVAGFEHENPGVSVEVFRAPTGELAARIAAEQREGGLRADVLWLTDPVSMEQYESDDMLAEVPEDAADAVDERFTSTGYVGTRLLNMVVVHGEDVAPPARWSDLPGTGGEQPVAVADPGFAGSALGALGYFALEDGDLGFYEDLEAAGAVQVQAPDEVTTGVAEGRFAAGMTLDNSARTAQEKGSPISFVAPDPGAIAIFSPIAVVAGSQNEDAARAFVSYSVSADAQAAIADTGWEPIVDGIAWPHDLPQVFPDWEAIVERQDELLEGHRAIFGG